ncbi:MAG: tail fiber domain-containing protein, partial [Terriglobales bacterium]
TGQTGTTPTAAGTLVPSPAITGSGTVNTLAKFDASTTNLISSSISDTGKAVSTTEPVGIGTATPNALLDVEFTTAAPTNALLSNITYNNSTAVTNAVVSAFDMNFMDSSTAANLSKQTARIALIRQPGATGTVTAFDSALTATEFLHASAPYPIRGINIEGPTMDAGTTLSNFAGLYIGSPSGAGTVTNKYALVTEPNAGNVGIGTTSPTVPLEVAGNLTVDSPGVINGNGSGLTNLNAANLTGILPSAALSGANGSGLTNLNAANLTGTLPSATLTGVDGSGLTNVNAAKLGGFLPGAFATTGANTFTGSQTINSGGTALTADGTGAGAIGLQASSNDVNGIGAVITNSGAGEILSVRDNTGFEVLHADAQGLILTARTDQYRHTNDATTGTVLNELATFTPQGTVKVISAGATGGAYGIVTAGAGTSGSAVVAIWGGAGCVFDNTAVDADYVQISPTAAGQCHDAGPTYPTSGQVVGLVINATAAPPSIRLFQTEVRGAGGGGTITAVNTAAGSGLMGGAASGAANLSLINSCGSGQVLQWNGTAWACATVSSGAGVTSVMAGTGLIGSPSNPITSAGTLTIDPSVVPELGANNTFAGINTFSSVALPNTTSASTGVITFGGTPFVHNYGTGNTFVGASAGNMTMDPVNAMQNTAVGNSALTANTTGVYNAAFGADALVSNTTGFRNSAFGDGALYSNTTGTRNSAFGLAAIEFNTTGIGNAGFGDGALYTLTTGNDNVAIGTFALDFLTTGNGNIALGYEAGNNLTAAESNDIYIGHVGVAGESNTIRIGDGVTQTAAFITGISGATSASGTAVFVNSNGQLGTVTSSRRFKHDIADMGAESDLLMKLRPVAFYYKPELDETQTRQYGLVAEEVAQVAPQLVVYDKDGVPQTVRYHFVNAMLLNAVQKQQRLLEEQRTTIGRQESRIQDLEDRLGKLEAALAKRH